MRTRKEDELIVLGEKGANFLEQTGENFVYFQGIGGEIEYGRAAKFANFLIEQYLKRRWGSISFIYPHFISVAAQQVKVMQFLPYKSQVKDSPQSIIGSPQNIKQGLIAEPSWERAVDYLVRLSANSKVYEIFWESKLSEWAARIIHLDGSIQTISDWYKDLGWRYIKCTHELRDISIREIFASRLA
jgi:F-type H+-transporting ATPase subunit gamma